MRLTNVRAIPYPFERQTGGSPEKAIPRDGVDAVKHADHEPGTMEDCPECQALAVEPGWYKAMRDERVVKRRKGEVVVPEAGAPDVDVVVPDIPARPDVEVLDLEPADRDER
jgi:hypothetical protein